VEIPEIGSRGPGGSHERAQLAALPGYLSDQDVAPGGIGAIRGFNGSPPGRPRRPTAAVQVRPIKRVLIFKDLQPRRQVLDLQPMDSAFEAGPHSLADLIADRDWRKRTSETLSHLFQ